MDNASAHHSDTLRELVESRYVILNFSVHQVHVCFCSGMRLVYLPAYSPDLNPIEEAFSCIKSWIRCNRDYVLGELDGHHLSDPYKILGGGLW